MPASETRLELPTRDTFGSPAVTPPSDATDRPRHPASATSTAIRRLLISVVGTSIVTPVLAVQALSTRPGAGEAVVAVAALVLIAVLLACAVSMYRSRRRSVRAYGKPGQRLSLLSGRAPVVDLESHAPAEPAATLAKSSVQAIIRERKLRAVYQPIVSMDDDSVIGAEALTRFTAKPDAPPDVWFAKAAEVGLGVDLELLALSTALESAHRLPGHIYLSINLSPDALADPRLTALLERGSWPYEQLVIEVTEHVSVADYASLVGTVATLRDLGVRIAVDDAGAGYASFRHILKLRPDYIKLDRALIDGIDADVAKRALAGAFVAFGEELHVLIVAEGVETAAELSAARALGVHAAQGFHTGRPAPPGDAWGR